MKPLIWPACALALMASGAQARPAAPEAALLAAEDGYARAIVAQDRAALEAALAPDMAYAHASGQEQARQAYIEGALAAGPGAIRGIRFASHTAQASGTLGYVHGVVVFDVGEPRRAIYTAVWRREGGRWRLVLWQNTPIRD